MNQLTVSLSRSEHRTVPVILFQFEYNTELISHVKKLQGKWSRTLGCWYLPQSQFDLKQVIGTFKGKAWVDASQLYGGKKPQEENAPKVVTKKTKGPATAHIEIPIEYIDKLKRRRYSQSTIDTYTSLFKQYMAYMSPRDIEAATLTDINEYID